MVMRQQAEKVYGRLRPAVEALGYELLGVEYLPQGDHSLLRLYIDSSEGISLGDCEKVSHQVRGVLEVESPLRGNYTLEVSSPGLDRPLFTLDQAERHVGSRVKLRLFAPLDGRRKFKGRLTRIDDGVLVIEDDAETWQVPWDRIEKANLEAEFE